MNGPPKSYVCAICSHRFKRKDHLKKHVETVHEKTRAFQCMLCERRFGQKYHLAIHVSAVHEGKKPYACDMCSHKSARKSGLQRHMRTVHNVKNPSIPSQPLLLQPTLVTTLTTVDQQQHLNAQPVTYTVSAQWFSSYFASKAVFFSLSINQLTAFSLCLTVNCCYLFFMPDYFFWLRSKKCKKSQ